MSFIIKLKRNAGIPEDELFEDLKLVAKKLGKTSLTMDEYEKNGKFKRGVFKRKFGSWNNALIKVDLEIRKRGNNTITDEELFKNLASAWEQIGRQPSQSNLDSKISKFHSGAYKKRFGTFNNALVVFSKWSEAENTTSAQISHEPTILERKTKRDPSLRLRYLVMKRDCFRCQAEWHKKDFPKSPSENASVHLEVDHKIPWSRGGETILENLRTLCSECNKAKSDL